MQAASELIPRWVEYGPLEYGALFIPLFAGLGWLSNRRYLAAAVAAPDEPWHEKARLVHRARVSAMSVAIVALLAPLMLGAYRVFLGPSLFGRAQVWQWVAIAALSSVACRIVASRSLARLRSPELLNEGVAGSITRLIVMRGGLVPMGLFLWLSVTLPRPWSYLSIAALVASVLLVSRLAFWVLKLTGIARPASPRVREAVKRAQELTKVPLREVVELPFNAANAFALPGVGVIAFTRPALAVLSDEEVEAVAAHELDHLSRSRAFVVTRLLFSLVLVGAALLLTGAIPSSLSSATGLLVLAAAVIVINGRIRRRLEVHADHAGQHAQRGEQVYAQALEKLYRVNRVPPVMGVRMRAHPELYDRMVAAGVQPGYPRLAPLKPAPPIVFVVGVGVFMGLLIAPDILPSRPGSEGELLGAMVITGGRPEQVRQLAEYRAADGKTADAYQLAKWAWELNARDPMNALVLAEQDAALDNCEEAVNLVPPPNERWPGVPKARRKRLTGFILDCMGRAGDGE